MSLKSSLLTVAAMAMAGSQNPYDLYSFGNGRPVTLTEGKPAPKRKCDQKKCKSCREFTKNAVHGGSCPWRRFVNPLDAACTEHYKKRKK